MRAHPRGSVGNHLILDHGTGEYSLLPISATAVSTAKAGQKSPQRDVSSAVSRSGMGPQLVHVHYELRTVPDLFAAQGLPARFERFRGVGATSDESGRIDAGWIVLPAGAFGSAPANQGLRRTRTRTPGIRRRRESRATPRKRSFGADVGACIGPRDARADIAWRQDPASFPAERVHQEGAMQPQIHLNWIAIVVAVIASFAVGGLWYGPLFGGPGRRRWESRPMRNPRAGKSGNRSG